VGAVFCTLCYIWTWGVVFHTFDCIMFGYGGVRVLRAVRVIFKN
jgi:hypothetical protein